MREDSARQPPQSLFFSGYLLWTQDTNNPQPWNKTRP